MTTLRTTDSSVVARVVAGDVDAYADIIARYETKLLRYVVYLIHDTDMASDVVQETFIKAYQNLRGFNDKYKFSSWIYRIAHNEAMNAVKKIRHATNDNIDELPETSYDAGLDNMVDNDMLKQHVRDCVRQLDQRYRDVVQLVYFEHMTYDDASDVLHVPPSTIGVWLLRAKKQLQKLCREKGVDR